MFLVTGTPRSATGWWSKFLSEMDIPCSHERYFIPSGSLNELLDWVATGGEKAESSWLAWAFLLLLPKPLPVIHTVRNPWKVIDSLTHRNDMLPKEAKRDKGKTKLHNVCVQYVPHVLNYDGAADRAAIFVIEWNRLIERACELAGAERRLVRADMFDGEIGDLLDWLDITRTSLQIDRAFALTPRNVNAGWQLEYDVEVQHPLVRAYMQEVWPDRPPVITRALSKPTPQAEEDIRAEVSTELAREVDLLAARYGYEQGEQHDESRNECALVR